VKLSVRANQGTVGAITGTEDGTYARTGRRRHPKFCSASLASMRKLSTTER
jgi:hypothetical protein